MKNERNNDVKELEKSIIIDKYFWKVYMYEDGANYRYRIGKKSDNI